MTAKLFILGRGIAYTLSPAIYNTWFRVHGVDARYEVVDAPSEDEAAGVVEKCRSDESCLGFNVTKPYKMLVARLVDSLEGAARIIEAVNTVAKVGGGLVAYNTDWIGVVNALRECGVLHHYSSVLIVGAGGAARAAAYALKEYAGKFTFLSKSGVTATKAAEWARRVLGVEAEGGRSTPEALRAALRSAELLVNASPASGADRSPVPVELLDELPRGAVVFDMVYRPLATLLLREARRRGHPVVDGLWMLVHQAAENIRLWFGVEADAAELRRYALNAMKPEERLSE